MGTVIVGISDCKVSADPADSIVTYALGSCVGLALYAPGQRIGGILHLMLPDSRYRSASRELNPYMYADTGVRAFLDALRQRGGNLGRLEARLSGGANMLQHSSLLDIGKRNVEAVLALLSARGIPVAGSSLGGVLGRSMSLRLQDGQVLVRLLGRGQEPI